MATFPTTLYPQWGYQSRQMENVKRNSSKSGATQKVDMWAGDTRFIAEMVFDLRTDDGLTVYKFWKQNRLATFTFFDYDDDVYLLTSIGTGNGVLLTFDLPAKGVRAYTISVNGVVKTAGVHYNLSVGTGASGNDRVVFTAGNAPGNGLAVRADEYKGKGLFLCSFSSEPTKESNAYGRQLYRFSVLED